MTTSSIPFQIADWPHLPAIEHPGETGTSFWRTLQFGGLRVRVVEYSANYLADHWCQKGHVMYILEGEMETELADGNKFMMTKGMTYVVSDEMSSHRSFSREGAMLFIVDGDFLKID